MGMERAIAEVRQARAALSWNGDSDLVERLTEWIAEQEPKTVTLHGAATGDPYKFSAITRLQECGGETRVTGNRGRTLGYRTGVRESLAEITRKAREAWSTDEKPWSCEGAKPRLAEEPKTVTLTLAYPVGQHPRTFASITGIEVCVNMGDEYCEVTGTAKDGTHKFAAIAESAARITELARAVWPEFDCEGAEPRLQPTVTLHGVNNGNPYDFVSIERLYKWSGCTRVEGCEADGTCGYRLVTELIADITIAARKVFGDTWDCEGAKPRLQPTVTLTRADSGEPISFEFIAGIEHIRPGRTSVDAGGLPTWAVSESPARITELAREAFGAGWNCEGAVPPVVVLSNNLGEYAFSRIDAISEHHLPGLMWVAGTFTRLWDAVPEGLAGECSDQIGIRSTEADIIAACAAAGVPCPQEEELLSVGDTYQDEYPDEPEVSKGAGKTPWHPGRCPCCGVDDGSQQRVEELEAEVENWRQINSEQVDADLGSWHAMRRERDKARARAVEMKKENRMARDSLSHAQKNLTDARAKSSQQQEIICATLKERDKYHTERDGLKKYWGKEGTELCKERDKARRESVCLRKELADMRRELNNALIRMTDERDALQEKLDAREDWRATEECSHCDGNGSIANVNSNGLTLYCRDCSYCNGTGLVVKNVQGPQA